MSGMKSKNKGKQYEREIAKYLKEHGYNECRRTSQFCGQSGDASDVVGLPHIHIECKHYKNRAFDYDWLKQAIRDNHDENKIPCVFHRIDREESLVTMRLDDFISLYKKAFSEE